MQLTTFLVESLKSGKVSISQNNVEAAEINVQNKKIEINAKNKQFVKDIVSSARKSATEKGVRESLHRGIDTLRTTRELVDDLCQEGVTITLSYKGDRVVTVGSEADSKFTRLITRTKGVEINSPRRLVELGL